MHFHCTTNETVPGTLFTGAALILSVASIITSASLPGVSEPVLESKWATVAPLIVANSIAWRESNSAGAEGAGKLPVVHRGAARAERQQFGEGKVYEKRVREVQFCA
jgi:hypothetical protein